MDMLDATLAFTLTLAALATIVTIILEAIHRLLRVRKWNLILTMKKLSREITNENLLSGKACWDFFTSVLNNDTRPEQQKFLTSDKLLKGDSLPESRVMRFFSFIWNKVSTLSFGNMKMPNDKDADSWMTTVKSINRNNATRGVFDKVSVEHVLRRFSELDEVQAKITESRALAEAQLDKIARKYEEFSSSVTADFKRRSKMWSIIIGVIIALSANVNAARIYESYLKDKNLSSRVIGKFEEFEKQADAAQKKLADTLEKTEKKLDLPSADKKSDSEDKYTDLITKKQNHIADLINQRGKLTADKLVAKNREIKEQQLALKKLIEQAYAESEAGKAQLAMNDAGEKLRSLSDLGVPIGVSYFPHCMVIDAYYSNEESKAQNQSSQCFAGQTQKKWWLAFFVWLFSTGLTGVLIGMGAPFWFDVARRIAEVRSMFNGKQDSEERMGGKDVDGDQKKRKELVKNIVDDAIADQTLA